MDIVKALIVLLCVRSLLGLDVGRIAATMRQSIS